MKPWEISVVFVSSFLFKWQHRSWETHLEVNLGSEVFKVERNESGGTGVLASCIQKPERRLYGCFLGEGFWLDRWSSLTLFWSFIFWSIISWNLWYTPDLCPWMGLGTLGPLSSHISGFFDTTLTDCSPFSFTVLIFFLITSISSSSFLSSSTEICLFLRLLCSTWSVCWSSAHPPPQPFELLPQTLHRGLSSPTITELSEEMHTFVLCQGKQQRGSCHMEVCANTSQSTCYLAVFTQARLIIRASSRHKLTKPRSHREVSGKL